MAVNSNLLRLFSNGESFLDNSGKPLVGEIEVFDKDQMGIPCQIYDVNGNYIANPQPTTDTGRPVQNIYLENKKSYIINFYKYISESNSDREFQYSVELPKNIFVFDYGDDSDSQAVWYFDNISQMTSEINAYEVGKIYGLKGYYEAGDKDIVYYRCVDYIGGDNGGSNITVYDSTTESEKTMLLIPPSEKYFDVRHFGIFPYPNETVNLSQLQNCDTYCYQYGYVMSFVPNGDNAIFFIENANTTLQSEIYGNNGTGLAFTNSTVNLTIDDCFINIIDAGGGNNINLYGNTIHQSNIMGIHTGIQIHPSINYIVDNYSPEKIVAKNVNLIITTDSTENVYDIDNCKIYSEGKINLSKANTIKNCYIKQSYFSNISENNIKNQTLSGNTTNKSDWFSSYHWLAFLIVGKQQEIDLNGAVSIGGYTLDIDVNTVIKNGTLSNGTITYPQGQFTMENVTCNSNALIKPYTVIKTTSNNYNVILNGCTFNSGNLSQFICRTFVASNCNFLGAGTGTQYGLNIDCEYVKAVNCTFYCDVFTCSYIHGTSGYVAFFSNNNFHSNLYIRPGTSTSSAYINADWGTNYNMWNYGGIIQNNNFYEANDSAGHIRIYQITWNNQTVPNQTGYITELLQINDNIIISNIKQTPLDTDRKWNWIQWPERPDPTNPATGILYQNTGAYSYKNNKGDFSFKYKIFKNCKTRKYDAAIEYDYKVNELICSKQIRSDQSNAWLWKSPLYPFIFSFGENKSRRIIKYKVKMDSWYCDNSQLDNAAWNLTHEHVLYNTDFERYIWSTTDATVGQLHYIKGVGNMNYKFAPPEKTYEGEIVRNYIGVSSTGEAITILTYNTDNGYPSTWGNQPDADCYHSVILSVEEL